jgi:hypothetical protein
MLGCSPSAAPNGPNAGAGGYDTTSTGISTGATAAGGDSSGANSTVATSSGGSGGEGGSAAGGGAGVGAGGRFVFDAAIDGPPRPPPDFGPNVLIFDPSMTAAAIQGRLDTIGTQQQTAQFGLGRYAYLFKPGHYAVDVKVNFYIQALGLGLSPDDVVITGAVRSKADWFGTGNATLNFWRGAENLAVVPTLDGKVEVWAVAQGTFLRRTHVQGPVSLSEGGFASGGFIADSKIDGVAASGSQQQFMMRNDDFTSWNGGVWNMVFVGSPRAPTATWPAAPNTVVPATPLVREKPFLFVDGVGNYYVMVPDPRADGQGPSWALGTPPGRAVPVEQFYIAHAETDTASTINAALGQGRYLLLTPGIYHLSQSIAVAEANTVVLGLGMATLVAEGGAPAMTIADVDGVVVAGLLLDAGPMDAGTLLEVGPSGSSRAHATNPASLHDVFCRVGGGSAGTVSSTITINSSGVIADNLWLWRADHGAGAGWTSNTSKNGLIVNGNDVTVYGLFVEHFQEYQVLWNGSGGRVFFYQSEMPYDPPSQAGWTHAGVNGYASYKVGDAATTHTAWGVGIYCAFRNAVVSDNAVEAPAAAASGFHHVMTSWLNGSATSAINHIMNGTGDAANMGHRQAWSAN